MFDIPQSVEPMCPDGSQRVIDCTEENQKDASAGVLAGGRWRPAGGEERRGVGVEEGHHHGRHGHHCGVRGRRH